METPALKSQTKQSCAKITRFEKAALGRKASIIYLIDKSKHCDKEYERASLLNKGVGNYLTSQSLSS